MKFVFIFLTLFNAVLSEQSTNEVNDITLATIWNRNSSTIISFFQFGSIISEKYILAFCNGIDNLENIGVAYGLYDISEVNIGNTISPKKKIITDFVGLDLGLLEMEKIGCNTRLACIPSFFDFNDKKLTILGYFIESGKVKSFDVSKVEKSECDKRYSESIDEKNEVCLSRKQAMRTYRTPFHWFDTENKKWYLVAIEWTYQMSDLIRAFNILNFKPWIQKVVEDGTLDALC